MSEEDQSQEKTQEPTEKRLSDARKKGQVLRSKELMTMTITLLSTIVFLFLGETMLKYLSSMLEQGLNFDRLALDRPDAFYVQALMCAKYAFYCLVPLLSLVTIAAFIAPAALGGIHVSAESLQPKLERLNIVKGIKKIFSLKSLMELFKSLLKFVFVGVIAYFIFMVELDQMIQFSSIQLSQGISQTGQLLARSFLWLCFALVLIAAIDVPFQIQQHTQQLKMTFQEVKDESKETDGSPEVKQKIRQQQQQFSQQRSVDKVPAADVIITNPEHYAVAIRYQQGIDDAPLVVAKGIDQVALLIKFKAKEVNKPIIESPPLARAIYYTTEIGYEIPFGLYKAVAQVLTHIYRLEQWYREGGAKPQLDAVDFDRKAFDY